MLLLDLALIFIFSLIALSFCLWLKIPPLVGFLAAGVAIGPSGLGLIGTVEEIEPVAEIGLILLLFTVGMEFSPRLLAILWRPFVISGLLYVMLMVGIGFLAATIYGREIHEALFLGFLLSLSSTAIVSKLLIEEGDLARERGKVAMAILIFQDVIAILMILMVPALSSFSPITWVTPLIALLKSLSLFVAAFLLSKFGVPILIKRVTAVKSRELLLVTLLAICFSVVWISGKMGLTLSMGAFLAGIVLSFGEYRHHMIGSILPFQDIFTNFFFLSLGMLVNIDYLVAHLPLIILISVGLIVAKTAVGFFSAKVLSLSTGASLFVALSLAEVGEFSFVLLKEGLSYNIGEIYLHQLFLSSAITTMALAPLLMQLGRILSKKVETKKVSTDRNADFAFIAGFGTLGQTIALRLKKREIPIVAVDLDPEIAEGEKSVLFGDAANDYLLKSHSVERARFAVVVVSALEEELRIVTALRQLSPSLPIVVRTRALVNEKLLFDAGATTIVTDERESQHAIEKVLLELVPDHINS